MENGADYNDIFGIDEGGQELPEPEAQEASADAQETQENEAQENAQGETQENAQSETQESETQESTQQSKEARAAAAAARRRAEAQRDAAVAKAKADAQRTVDEYVRSLGMTDPYTGKLITTQTELTAYREHMSTDRRASFLKRSGMSEQEFNAFVESLPEVQRSREAQRKAEEALREANEAKTREKVDAQLREIGGLDPKVKTLDDLAAMETYPQFYALVRKGYSLTDAFKIANFETLRSTATAATKQAALNSVQSRQHMTKTAQRGTGAVSVPQDVKELYRAFNPEATDAEIQAHYNRSRKKG